MCHSRSPVASVTRFLSCSCGQGQTLGNSGGVPVHPEGANKGVGEAGGRPATRGRRHIWVSTLESGFDVIALIKQTEGLLSTLWFELTSMVQDLRLHLLWLVLQKV